MSKNIHENAFAQPGAMTWKCAKCDTTLFLPVTLALFAKVKVFGPKMFKRNCKRCNDEITITIK